MRCEGPAVELMRLPAADSLNQIRRHSKNTRHRAGTKAVAPAAAKNFSPALPLQRHDSKAQASFQNLAVVILFRFIL
jgi:hypothetical protein